MNMLRDGRWPKYGVAATLLAAVTVSQTFAATSALQPASPSALQQAQPAFGEKVEPVDPKAATPKKLEPLGLKAAPALGLKPSSDLPQAGAAVKGPTASRNGAAKSARKLFDMEDRAIIIVSGRQTTAGDLKRALNAEIASKAGPPRTVKGGARRLDLVALNVARNTTSVAPPAQTTVAARADTRAAKLALAPSALSTYSQSTNPAGPNYSAEVTAAVNKSSTSAVLKDILCADKGPPKISEVVGRLKPGSKFSVWGRCFGVRPGRVEIIGQFPGGKLTVPFTAWDMSGVDLEMPANIRGASDHAVAVTIITADGKTTPAMQASFVAARERIEVPDRLWSPAAGFELASTVETLNTANGTSSVNPAASGQIAKSLRVNPQCALDNMDAMVLSGSVSQIRGWELGPANEATVTIDWIGTCIRSTTTTSYHYVIAQVGDDISVSSACRVAFQARAWAYCPVGVAP
jgi:hypothetical protein